MKKILAAAATLAILAVLAPAHAATGPDYAAAVTGGPAQVAPGGTFTRTLVITNLGDSGGAWPVSATIRGLAHSTFVSVTSTGFVRCSLVKYASGAPNYARCFNAYLLPGATASMTVTYRAPVAGWAGWVYGGNGAVDHTSMELDSNPANDYAPAGPTTVVLP